MTILSAIAAIVKYLLLFVGAMAVLFALLVIVVSRLRQDNPLRRVLVALCFRVAATLGAGLIAIPIEPVPGVDVAYDVVVPLLLIIYWIGFFRTAFRAAFHEGETAATIRRID